MQNNIFEKIKTSKPFNKLDFIFLALVLMLIVISIFIFFYQGNVANRVEIYIDGKIESEYNLNVDKLIELDNLTIIIKDKQITIIDATCKDKLCEKYFIDRGGQAIICLPNKVVVKIVGKEFDVIA